MSTNYSIRELAREFGVSLRTLRFYEGKGLVAPGRNGMQRVYTERDRRRLAEVIMLARLGFSLKAIREQRVPATRAERLKVAHARRLELDQVIGMLEGRAA